MLLKDQGAACLTIFSANPYPAPPPLIEIYRSDPPRRRECLYYLSLGHFKMGNYDEARRFNGE